MENREMEKSRTKKKLKKVRPECRNDVRLTSASHGVSNVKFEREGDEERDEERDGERDGERGGERERRREKGERERRREKGE